MLKKVLSYIITVFFLLNNITEVYPLVIEGVPLVNRNIYIPESYGVIEKSSFDQYESQKYVIVLKDAHCNYDAQHNIAKILESLVRDYKIGLVAIEGAAGFLDYNKYEKLENETAREKMADFFVKNGILTGPEYLKISEDGKLLFNIYGVEDEKLYVQNFKTFRQTIGHLDETRMFIEETSRVINNIKKKIYPEKLYDFDEKSISYGENAISLTDWVKILKEVCAENGVKYENTSGFNMVLKSVDLEERIDFKKIESERTSAINNIEKTLSKDALKEMVEKSLQYRLAKMPASVYYEYLEKLFELNTIDFKIKYPNLYGYIQLVKMQKTIDNNLLFKDIEKLEEDVKLSMIKGDAILLRLNNISKRTAILKGLFNLTLTREDFERYRNDKSSFLPSEILSFINIQAPANNVPVSMLLADVDFIKKVETVIADGEKFYDTAVERDMSLVENTLEIMNEKKQDNAVMVIGGFHTEGVINLFKEKGIGYVVISPKIMKAEKQGLYLSLMMDKRINIGQAESTLAFPKLLAVGEENTAKIVIPMGMEGWQRSLANIAMQMYGKYLGKEVVGEVEKPPYYFTVNPDGTVSVDENPDFTDASMPDKTREWYRLGLQDALKDDADLQSFVRNGENIKKYLGSPAIVEYSLKTGHMVSDDTMREATKEFIKFYLELCDLYERGGWISVREKLGNRFKELMPEPIEAQEEQTDISPPAVKENLVKALGEVKDVTSMDEATARAIVNYLLSTPAFGKTEDGKFYETLFFDSFISLVGEVFSAVTNPDVKKYLDQLQAYRFLQAYLNVGTDGQIKANESAGAILASGSNSQKLELLARYLSGEGFGTNNEALSKLAGRKVRDWGDMDWVKAAQGINVLNENNIKDPLKREVYIERLKRESIKNALDASDGYIRQMQIFETKTADGLLQGIKNSTFVHDISMYLGDVKETATGKYEYSDMGVPAIPFLRAIQRSKNNNQYFLYENDAQKEAMKAYLKGYGIPVDDAQFKNLNEYEGIERTGRIIVVMLNDKVKDKVKLQEKDRLLAGNSEACDLMLMSRLALVIAKPEDLETAKESVTGEMKNILQRYYSGADGATDIDKILQAALKDGILRILLPPITPFVKGYYDTLMKTREVVSKAA